MKTLFYNWFLASAYGAGTYSNSTYNGGSVLADTGIAMAAIVAAAALILLIAMAVRIWKRPSKKAPAAENDESTQ